MVRRDSDFGTAEATHPPPYNQAKSGSLCFWSRSMELFLTAAAFAFGLAFGSFLNVCIYRLPRGLSVVAPRSACPNCERAIPFYENVPVIGWLALRGRCRGCKQPISPRYLVIELLIGLLFAVCFVQFGPTVTAVKYCVFGFLVLGLIFTDAETFLLPDKMTLPGLALGLSFSLFVPVNDLVAQLLPGLVSLPNAEVSWRLLSLADALAGAAVGASFIYGAGAIYLRARGVEGMGFGDVKLMAMIGAFLGVKLTVFTLFAASLAGSLFGMSTMLAVWMKRTRRRIVRLHEPAEQARHRAWGSAMIALRRHQMPFGVFLGSMAIVALFFGNQLLRWYWGLL
jgi:leader peptidase (prepilin peptidase) / N-methyltransferase